MHVQKNAGLKFEKITFKNAVKILIFIPFYNTLGIECSNKMGPYLSIYILINYRIYWIAQEIILGLARHAIRHPEITLPKVILWKAVQFHGLRGWGRYRSTFVDNLLIVNRCWNHWRAKDTHAGQNGLDPWAAPAKSRLFSV